MPTVKDDSRAGPIAQHGPGRDDSNKAVALAGPCGAGLGRCCISNALAPMLQWLGRLTSGSAGPGPPMCLAGRRQAVGCGWLLGDDTVHSILTRHNGTSTQLFTSSYRNSTHAPTYSLTQVLGWNRAPILTGPHPRSRRPSCTPPHIPRAHFSTHPSLTYPSIANGPRGVGYCWVPFGGIAP